MSHQTQIESAAADIPAEIVIERHDQMWDESRRAFNLVLDQQPELILMPRSAAEVGAAVRFAAERGLRVAVQRTGHGAVPLGSLKRAMLLKTNELCEVSVDPSLRRARVGAGARWGDVVPLAAASGLAAMHGTSFGVGVIGYTLGGGLSWYARKHGLASNHVRAVELVDADGQLRRVDAANDPDLFWALRGGGGDFGVVVALEFDLLDLPERHGGTLFFPAERTAEVFGTWRELLPTLPDETTSIARVLQFPPDPEVPEPLRGGSFAAVHAVHLGPAGELSELLEPLRRLGPALDQVGPLSLEAVGELHMDPVDPLPYGFEGWVVDDLDAAEIDELAALTAPPMGSLVSFELRHLGGALAREAPGHGAIPKVGGLFMAGAIGVTPDADAEADFEARVAALAGVLGPRVDGALPNFANRPTDPSLFFGASLDRLRELKRAADPHSLFQAKHAILAKGWATRPLPRPGARTNRP